MRRSIRHATCEVALVSIHVKLCVTTYMQHFVKWIAATGTTDQILQDLWMQPAYGDSQYGYSAQAIVPAWDLGQLHQVQFISQFGVLPASVAVISSPFDTAVFGIGGLLGPEGFAAGLVTSNSTAGSSSRRLLSSAALQNSTPALNATSVTGGGNSTNATATATDTSQLQDCPGFLVGMLYIRFRPLPTDCVCCGCLCF